MAVSKQLFEPVLPWLISTVFLGLALGTMTSVASVSAGSPATGPGPPAAVNIPPEASLLLEPRPLHASSVATWHHVCLPQQITVIGAGMGDAQSALNPQTVHLPTPDQLTSLLLQVAGRYPGTPQTPAGVVFSSESESIAVTRPTTETGQCYDYETTELQPTGQVTAWVNGPGEIFHTPRGLVAYAWQPTGGARWTSVGKTSNVYIYRKNGDGLHTEPLTFEPLAGPRDLKITVVVIDNDEDERPLVVEAAAGPVSASRSFTGPTHGPLLNIVSLELPAVPTGTDRATVTLRSPADNGDSVVLAGVDVSYECNSDVNTGIYLPIVLKNHATCTFYSFNYPEIDWKDAESDNSDRKTGQVDGEFQIRARDSSKTHLAWPRGKYKNYKISADVRWAQNAIGDKYGLIFDIADDRSSLYTFMVYPLHRDYEIRYYDKNDETDEDGDGDPRWDTLYFGHSAIISTGITSNHLSIKRIYPKIGIEINGTHIVTITDKHISGSKLVGIGVGPYDALYNGHIADARFDNFQICPPNARETEVDILSNIQTQAGSISGG